MEILPLSIPGVFGIKLTQNIDNRGTFARLWNSKDLNMNFSLSQVSLSINQEEYTLRGMHYQDEADSENKIIICTQGKVFDVAVDVRKHSRYYLEWIGLEIGMESEFQGIFIEKGFAHGYLTLEPNSHLVYCIDNPYKESSARGILWNDPKVGIAWPSEPKVLSTRDTAWSNI